MRLPLTQVKAEIEKLIDLNQLNSDDDLIAYLRQYLTDAKAQRGDAGNMRIEMSFIDSQLFKSWGQIQ